MQTKRFVHISLTGLLCSVSLCAMAQATHSGERHLDKDVVLQDVVVTGTGTKHLLKDAPVQTEVITRKMIESYGGKSIEEILGGLTASFAFNEGDMGSQMQLNGLGNNYILILIDGKRIHGDNGGENDLGLIDPHNIERIEIVKGAQSALYGSDAIAGVVNIITKRPKTEGLMLENSTRYGSYNDLRQHNGISFSYDKLTSYTSFQLQHNDGWQNTARQHAEGKVLPDTKTKTANEFTNWQIGERLTYQATKRLELYADGTYYTKNILRPTNGKYPSCDVYTYDLMYRNASASVGGKWNINESKKDVLTVDVDWNMHNYYYKYTARTYEYMKLGGEGYGDLNGEWYPVPFYAGQKNLQSGQQRLLAQGKGILHLPYDNILTSGVEYRWDYLHAPERTENGSASDRTTAVYVQDEFDYLRHLNITAGLRLVGNEGFGAYLSPKVSAMISLGDFRIRAGWSRGFKTPTVKERYYRYLHVMGSSTFFNIGNMNLKPQTSNYWSASGEYRGRRATFSVTGYYNKLDNMIALVNVPVEEIPAGVQMAYLGDGSGKVQARLYKNMEDAMTWGVDVNASYKITKELSINSSYSYLDTKAHQYDDKMNRILVAVIDGMAHNKWNATLIYGHKFSDTYKLGASLTTRGSSKRYYENNGDGKAFQIWRINSSHDFGKSNAPLNYRVELGMDNIFGFRDTTIHPYHLGNNTPGRTVYVNFSVKFNKGKKIQTNNIINKKQNNNEED